MTVQINVVKRDGSIAPFESSKISKAVTKAFKAVGNNNSTYIKAVSDKCAHSVYRHCTSEGLTSISVYDIEYIVENISFIHDFIQVDFQSCELR